MRPTTAWQAITAGPRTFLRSTWPWRALAYIVTSAALYAAAAVAVVALVVAGVLLAAFLVGLAALVACVLLGPFVADLERRRLAMVDDSPTERRPVDLPTGFWRRLRRRLRDERTWREFGFLLLNIVSLWVVDVLVVALVVVLPVGLFLSFLVDPADGFLAVAAPLLVLLLAPVCAYVVTAWAAARGAVTRAVLAPRVTEDGLRLQEVTRSRSRLVGAFDTERARLERDLHDGAQQRLVLLKVHLGMAALDLPPGSPAHGGIARAQQEAALALEDLREATRGLSPRVLRDRGLADAVRDVTGRLPLPVALDLDLPDELPEVVETAGYYALSEALTNVVKHSQATQACVRSKVADGWLRLEVSDDGVGGARIGAGMGLTGIADRVHAVDGRVFLSSPAGGPTTLRIELPCPSG